MLKKVTLIAALCGVCLFSYGQSEKQDPFTFEGSYIGDFYGNAFGGVKTGVGFLGMGNLGVAFGTGSAGWWRGGRFVVSGNSIHGKSPTASLLGDFQVASNIDGFGTYTYLQNLFFSQRFDFRKPGTGLTLTVGLQGLDAEFMVLESGLGFLNNSFAVPPPAATGTPLPVFPVTRLGVVAAWDIDGRFTLKAGIYDGHSAPYDEGNQHNTEWRIGKNDGIIAVGEFQSHIRIGGLPGEYKVGAYHHSGEAIHDVALNERQEISSRNWGIYFIGDQRVCSGELHDLNIFVQANAAPKKSNMNNLYLGLGTRLIGVFSKQKRDEAGVGVAYAKLNGMVYGQETTVEAFYKYNFNDNIALQPDLQYIIDPAGTDAKLKNALLCTVRLRIDF